MRFAQANRRRATRLLETHNSFGNRSPFARPGKALSRRILAGDGSAANAGLVRPMQLENSARWRADRSLTIECAPLSRRANPPSDPMPDSLISSGSIAFLGFGEAAQAFLAGWRTNANFKARICAYDIKTDSPDSEVRTAKRADYAAANVLGASTAAEALTGAEAVFSVVTADQAHEAAIAALPGLAKGALFFDCDSCAPQTKTRTAQDVEAAGGLYVDVAVMAAVHPRLHRTPLLISGPHVEAAAPALASLGMSATIHDGPVGAASSVKMIRSVMMKGLEALVCECVLAGRKAGVIETVLDSLDDTYPGFDWKKRSAYMLERVMTHGVRRAAEMREVALTVDLLGLKGEMSRASVGWEQAIGELGLRANGAEAADYRVLADRILAALDPAAREG
jgi:3-hydroxyisobutyrate dehydrogenase-like beta-hydroxyacid dehydrogenase